VKGISTRKGGWLSRVDLEVNYPGRVGLRRINFSPGCALSVLACSFLLRYQPSAMSHWTRTRVRGLLQPVDHAPLISRKVWEVWILD